MSEGGGHERDGRGETRDRIYRAALALFRDKGFDATTMRDVATAAGMSLGAAYYYFRSKEAIVLAFYGEVHAAWHRRGRALLAETTDLAARIRGLLHLHHAIVADDRALLGAIVRTVADPASPLSVFSSDNQRLRSESIGLYFAALEVDEVPDDLRDLGALGLWTLDLALMLYLVWDDSPEQVRTHRLVDEVVDLVAGALPLLSLPLARPFLSRVARILVEARLVPE